MTIQLGNKILIIGCAGSGKTTLAKILAKTINIPVIHMDRFYWQANWGRVEDEKWQEIVLSFCEQEAWIMDGNYTSSLPLRMKYATSIIYLDVPRWKCLLRAFIRRFRLFHNLKRQDIPKDCKDRINLEFYQWIWNYPHRSRPKTMSMLQNFPRQVFILKTRKDIRAFLTKLGT